MLGKLLPERLDNSYRGYKTALWLFGLVIALRGLQSVMIIVNGRNTIQNADGISLDSYPAEAAQTLQGLFAQNSLWRLLVSLLGVVVLARYRSAVPLMFVLSILSYVGAQALWQFIPLVRTGPAPGTTVNLVMFGVMAVGLVLSLIERPLKVTSN